MTINERNTRIFQGKLIDTTDINIVLRPGELSTDLTTYTLFVHDGVTPGGLPLSHGAQGPTGLSAYQLAVNNGFHGTEAQWLASLVGPQGPAGAGGAPGSGGTGTNFGFLTSSTEIVIATDYLGQQSGLLGHILNIPLNTLNQQIQSGWQVIFADGQTTATVGSAYTNGDHITLNLTVPGGTLFVQPAYPITVIGTTTLGATATNVVIPGYGLVLNPDGTLSVNSATIQGLLPIYEIGGNPGITTIDNNLAVQGIITAPALTVSNFISFADGSVQTTAALSGSLGFGLQRNADHTISVNSTTIQLLLPILEISQNNTSTTVIDNNTTIHGVLGAYALTVTNAIYFPDGTSMITAATGNGGGGGGTSNGWQLTSSTAVVSLASNGILTLPNNSTIVTDGSDGTYMTAPDTGYAGMNADASWVWVDSDGAYLEASNGALPRIWWFDKSGTINIPNLLPTITFTAILVPVRHSGDPGASAWTYDVHFVIGQDGSIETQIDNSLVRSDNPGYQSGDSYTFTEADHGIPGYSFTITLRDVTHGLAGWTANLEVSPPPAYPSTVYSNGAIKLSANDKDFVLGANGALIFPDLSSQKTAVNIIQSDTHPTGSTSTLWYDTVGGRSYVYFDNSWVDASPISTASATTSTLVNGSYHFTLGVDGTINFDPASNGKGVLQTTADLWFNANGAIYNFGATGDLTLAGGNVFFSDAPDSTVMYNNGISVSSSTAYGISTGGVSGSNNLYWFEKPENAATGLWNAIRLNSAEDAASTGSIVISTGQFVSRKNWIYAQDGTLTLPGNLIADGISLVGAPYTITITDTGGVWPPAVGVYTRLNGITPPKWTPANYNPGSDSYITYDSGWKLKNPAFGATPVYLNTGTLFSPSAIWNPNTPAGLGGNSHPAGAYTYKNWTFGTDGTTKFPGTIYAQASDNGSIIFSDDGSTDHGSIKVDGGHNMVINAESNYYVKRNGQDRLGITDTDTTLMAGRHLVLKSNKNSTEQVWSFNSNGSVTFPDNTQQTTAFTGTVAYSNITGAPASVNKTSGSWILATGANTVSITVAPGNNYQMWLNGNISNGIVEWNATVNVSNPNVPAIGSQYAWYYAPGNALVLTAIPNQIVGTSGVISSSTSYTGTTSNVFSFGITNNSASTQTVYWGYTTL